MYVVDLSRIITHFLFHLKIKLWQKKPLKNFKTYKNFHSGLNLFKNREKRSLLFDFFLEKSISLGFIRESEGKNKIETERKQLNDYGRISDVNRLLNRLLLIDDWICCGLALIAYLGDCDLGHRSLNFFASCAFVTFLEISLRT